MSKTKKAKGAKVEEKTPQLEEVPVEVIPPEPRFLTEESLHLWKVWEKEKSPREIVPPQTPNPEYNFENYFHPFPHIFPDLDTLEIPYVRDKGVKFCIDYLSVHFGCKDYKFNMLQFWFLDVLTDCIWTAQDNFHLPVDQQKMVLAWVLYLINILRDQGRNMSRKTFFTVFKEAILIAAEVIDEGCGTVPPPEKLFATIQEDEELKSWASSDSDSTSSSVEISDNEIENISCVDLIIDEKRRRFILPEETCNCAKYDLSSVDSILESLEHSDENLEDVEEVEEKGEEEEEKFEAIEFYQPNLDIPPRFLPLPEESEEECIEEETRTEKPMCKMKDVKNQNKIMEEEETKIEEEENRECGVYEIPEQFCIRRTSEVSKTIKTLSDSVESNISNIEQLDQNLDSKTKFQRESIKSGQKSPSAVFLSSQLFDQYQKKQVLKDLASQKLWEQRIKDMDNPRKGWMPSPDELEALKNETVIEEGEEKEEEEEEQTSDEPEESEDEEWADIIFNEQTEQIQNYEDILILNFGVLRAIIDFVFKYFYESFQFTLVKLAFQATPEIISQKVNHEWKIPKRIKQELQKPKVEKPKKSKEKKKKDKKSSKGSKKSKKDKSKKGKSSKKTDKKGSSKKSKKEKKAKPKKLTKEEKAELERQRKEQERIEAELRKIEENKRFMFPLTEAASDDLFNRIFENWVKIDLTKKGKGKGKDKGKGKGKGKGKK